MTNNPYWLTEGKIKVIRSEKAHSLVFIQAILESESLVQRALSYQLWPHSLIATCVFLTFSGLLMKAEKTFDNKIWIYQTLLIKSAYSETSF